MRLDKFLSHKMFGSRKEVKAIIKDGLVLVDDIVIKDASYHISPLQEIKVGDTMIDHQRDVLIMMNKPKGYVCAVKDNLHKTVFEFLKPPYDSFDLRIVGRLDKDTEGLLLLTNKGHIVHSLTSPKKDVYKRYYVETQVDFKDLERLTQPFSIKDGKNNLYTPLKPKVTYIKPNCMYIDIKEGKFHQVKRMISHFGYEVTHLKRLSIGHIDLDETLPLGSYKEIPIKDVLSK